MIVGNRVDGFTEFEAGHASGGFGTLQVGETGPWAGLGIIAYHAGGNSWFSTTDLTTFTPTFALLLHLRVTSHFLFTKIMEMFTEIAQTENCLNLQIRLHLLQQDIFRSFAYPAVAYNSEYLLKKSPNGQYLVHVGAWGNSTAAGGANGGPFGAHPDSTDFVGMNYSTDGGTTWTFELMGRDGLTSVFNRTGYLPMFENFGQLNFAVDNNGVVHVGMNGYGARITATDTVNAYPALYWNSRDKKWLAVTSETVEVDYDTTKFCLFLLIQEMDIGNAYAVPCISEDGSKIVLLWQGPEYIGTPR